MIDLLYRRPSSRKSFAESTSGKSSDVSSRDGIPQRLEFDSIMGGLTSAPCTTDDFENYLRYNDGNVNDLQFYQWFRDYTQRFCKLSVAEQVLSPVAELQEGPSRTDSQISLVPSSEAAPQLNFGEDITLQPFTVQPFRAEIERVISLYLTTSAPLPLSIDDSIRASTLGALFQTTHPSALSAVLRSIEDKLLNEAHPSFIRYTLSNATKTRLEFVNFLGTSLIAVAFILAIVLTLSRASRWWRLWSLFFLFPGMNMLANARRGLCFLLVILGMSRNLSAWEVYAVQQGDLEKGKIDFDQMGDKDEEIRVRCFVTDYKNRPMMSRVFEKRVYVKDPEVRRLQLSIIAQNAMIVGTITAVFEVIFVALPHGDFF